MKALTVKQPWGHLISTGQKRIENRAWSTRHRGPLAIHAARTPDRLDADTLDELDQLGITIPATLDYGAIVAVVNLVDCVALDDLPPALAADPFAFGPFVWILADARPVAPIPCRGKLGLWEVPEGIGTL